MRPNPKFQGADTEAATLSESGTTAATTASTASPTSDATSGATASAGTSAASDPTTGSSTGAGQPAATSCKEILANLLVDGTPPPPSGIYTLAFGNSPVDVYCDMATEEGGWTLVGRSAGLDQIPDFGWRSQTGDVSDDGAPYSLDLAAHPVPFTELLVGDRGEGKAWGDHRYLFAVPADLVEGYRGMDAMAPITLTKTISGSCDPAAIEMFRYAGYTDSDQSFYFRDMSVADDAYYGLLGEFFYLFHDSDLCSQTGELHKKQGMIMVR